MSRDLLFLSVRPGGAISPIRQIGAVRVTPGEWIARETWLVDIVRPSIRDDPEAQQNAFVQAWWPIERAFRDCTPAGHDVHQTLKLLGREMPTAWSWPHSLTPALCTRSLSWPLSVDWVPNLELSTLRLALELGPKPGDALADARTAMELARWVIRWARADALLGRSTVAF